MSQTFLYTAIYEIDEMSLPMLQTRLTFDILRS